MADVRTILKLSAPEWRLLAAAACVVIPVRLALYVLPSAFILRQTRRLTAPVSMPGASPASLGTILWAVEAVSRRVPGATCLTQALSAQLLLRRHGHAATLCLGVARSDAGEFRAHAWLEREGRAILGGSGLQVFNRLPHLHATARKD